MDRRNFISALVGAVTSLFVKRQAYHVGVDIGGGASQTTVSQWTYSNQNWRNYTSTYSNVSKEELIAKMKVAMANADFKKPLQNLKVLGGNA